MKKNIPFIIIAVLIVLTGFSLSKYFYLQKANSELEAIIKENRGKIDDLVNQLMNQKELNQQLAKEKENLSNELMTLSEQYKKADAELLDAKDKLSAVQTKINLLKKENAYLSQLRYSFDEKMAQVTKEKESLETKLSSIEELRKSISELKKKMREERLAARGSRKPAEPIDGNRGYIIWKGQSTIKTKVKIEVIPAP